MKFFFQKIVNSQKWLTISQRRSFIINVSQGPKYTSAMGSFILYVRKIFRKIIFLERD